MGSHCQQTQVNTARLNPRQTGWYSICLPRRDRRLSWPRWLHTEMVNPPRWSPIQVLTQQCTARSWTCNWLVTSPMPWPLHHQATSLFSCFSVVVHLIWAVLFCESLALARLVNVATVMMGWLTALWQATTRSVCHRGWMLVTHTLWLLTMNLTSATGFRNSTMLLSLNLMVDMRLTLRQWTRDNTVRKSAGLWAAAVKMMTSHLVVWTAVHHWCPHSHWTPSLCQVSVSLCRAAGLAWRKMQTLTVELSLDKLMLMTAGYVMLVIAFVMLSSTCWL